MKEKLTKLIEIRKIIALMVTLLFIVRAFQGELDSKFVEHIILTVVVFYFAKSTALDKPDKED